MTRSAKTHQRPPVETPAVSKSEQAYQDLKWRLIMGDVAPGAKISIRRQAEEMGLGAMPVREALKRLASEQALEASASRSFRVAELDPGRISNLLFVRSILEGAATELAVPRFTRPALARAEELAGEMDRDIDRGDIRAYLANNYSFHFLIYTAAANAELAGIIEGLWVRTGPFVAVVARASDKSGDWRETHLRIVDAIRTRDAGLARRLIEADISWGIRLYREIGDNALSA